MGLKIKIPFEKVIDVVKHAKPLGELLEALKDIGEDYLDDDPSNNDISPEEAAAVLEAWQKVRAAFRPPVAAAPV